MTQDGVVEILGEIRDILRQMEVRLQDIEASAGAQEVSLASLVNTNRLGIMFSGFALGNRLADLKHGTPGLKEQEEFCQKAFTLAATALERDSGDNDGEMIV